MKVYDEPTGRRHRAVHYAHSPDPQRPGVIDQRVIETDCGMKIALIGHPRHKPVLLTCRECK